LLDVSGELGRNFEHAFSRNLETNSGEEKITIKEPMIPGHEFVGIVVEVGENAAKRDHVKVGDRLAEVSSCVTSRGDVGRSD
jgi:D-arabinose 1-dehydrogenase-like Zn-dependent alcohol dehydrogenase